MPSTRPSTRFQVLFVYCLAAAITALFIGSSVFAAGSSRFAFVNSSGSQGVSAPVASEKGATIGIRGKDARGNAVSLVNVSVSLPAVMATPGAIAVPITVGDVTGLGVISY